ALLSARHAGVVPPRGATGLRGRRTAPVMGRQLALLRMPRAWGAIAGATHAGAGVVREHLGCRERRRPRASAVAPARRDHGRPRRARAPGASAPRRTPLTFLRVTQEPPVRTIYPEPGRNRYLVRDERAHADRLRRPDASPHDGGLLRPGRLDDGERLRHPDGAAERGAGGHAPLPPV